MGGGVPVRRGPLEWRAAPAAASGAPVAAPRSQSLPRRGAARAEPGRPAHRSHRRAPRVKILPLSKFYPPDPGGLEQVVAHLAEGAAARGHEIRVIAATGSGWVRNPGKRITEPPRRGVVVVRLPTRGVLWSQPPDRHPPSLGRAATAGGPPGVRTVGEPGGEAGGRGGRRHQVAPGPRAGHWTRRAGQGARHSLRRGRGAFRPAPAPTTASELPTA